MGSSSVLINDNYREDIPFDDHSREKEAVYLFSSQPKKDNINKT